MQLSYLLSKRFRQTKHRSGFMAFMAKSSTLGIALGVAVLIIALSVMNGFEQQLVERLLAVTPHVEYTSADTPIENWQQKLTDINQQQGVKNSAPFIAFNAMVQFRGQLQAAQLRAIHPEYENRVSAIDSFNGGKPLNQLQPNELLLGKPLAEALKVKQGQVVSLLLPDQSATSKQLKAPLRLSAKVVGLVETGSPSDAVLAIMHLAQAQQHLGLQPNQTLGLRLSVDNVFNAQHTAMKVGQTLQDYVYVNSWERSQGSLYQDIQLVRVIVYLSVFLIIAVASFNIVSSLVMEVKEKQANIAILRTMGASDGLIISTFILQGFIGAVVALIIGCSIGILIAYFISDLFALWFNLTGHNPLAGVYFIDFLPSQIKFGDVITVVVVTLIIAFLATLYPAWQASKIDPAKVLGN